jgi:hypothetical protein
MDEKETNFYIGQNPMIIEGEDELAIRTEKE